MGKGAYERIYTVIRRIPKGRVATYGQVARLAGLPGHARQVGYALSALPEDRDVAWHRVVNSEGRISARAQPGWEERQRSLLEREGIAFGEDARIFLARYQWKARGTP